MLNIYIEDLNYLGCTILFIYPYEFHQEKVLQKHILKMKKNNKRIY